MIVSSWTVVELADTGRVFDDVADDTVSMPVRRMERLCLSAYLSSRSFLFSFLRAFKVNELKCGAI